MQGTCFCSFIGECAYSEQDIPQSPPFPFSKKDTVMQTAWVSVACLVTLKVCRACALMPHRQLMKVSKGQGNPAAINKMLNERLKG